MNRTLPSHMPTLTPPGCLLRGLLTIPRPVKMPPLLYAAGRADAGRDWYLGAVAVAGALHDVGLRGVGRIEPGEHRGVAPPGEPAQVEARPTRISEVIIVALSPSGIPAKLTVPDAWHPAASAEISASGEPMSVNGAPRKGILTPFQT